jgi:WD40 repeat protein
MSFSPDGSLLAAGGLMIQLWDLTSSHLEAELTGHSKLVRDVSRGRDGVLLASASDDETVALWNLSDHYNEVRTLKHPEEVYGVAFSPDCQWLASACGDGVVRLWDTATARLDSELRGHARQCRAVRFSPDGSLLASVSRGDNTIRFWDAAERKALQRLPLINGGVMLKDLAFHPDGRWLATVGGDIQNVENWVKVCQGLGYVHGPTAAWFADGAGVVRNSGVQSRWTVVGRWRFKGGHLHVALRNGRIEGCLRRAPQRH